MYVRICMDTLPRLIYKDVNAQLKKLIAVIYMNKKIVVFISVGYNYLLTLHASTVGSGDGAPA